MLYKTSKGLLRAFKGHANAAHYSEEGRGAVPTHKGGGTLLGGANRIPIDETSMQLHDRALAILAAGAHSGMSYGDALKLARKEAADKALADARGPQFAEMRFAEGGRIPIDQNSICADRRAKEIMAEDKERRITFGEALKMARAEMRNE
jgi:hypothetical protein